MGRVLASVCRWAAALAALPVLAWAQPLPAQAPLAPAEIRFAPDGAGPSHLFWLTGPAPGAPGGDIVAVVDPLYAAIRLFRIDRTGQSRVHALGACALPVSFRVWRLHQMRDRVVLQSMPSPGPAGAGVTAGALRTRLYVIRRDLPDGPAAGPIAQANGRIASPGWDPARAIPCGEEQRWAPVTRPIAYQAERTGPGAVRLSPRAGSLTPARPLTARTRHRLYSAQELEPAGAVRTVLVTEGLPGSDGMLRMAQRLLVFRPGARRPAELGLDLSLLRTKLGQRPLAILPGGEVVAMGDDGAPASDGYTRFRFHTCGNVLSGAPLAAICGGGRAARTAPSPAPAAIATRPPPSDRSTGSAGDIFRRAAPWADVVWQVDASLLAPACRDVRGCDVRGQRAHYVPLRGLRLARGLYRQTGAPYAQTGALGPAHRFLTMTQTDLDRALRQVRDGRGGQPGNLDNSFVGDLGIDCSALLQLAWSARPPVGRISTQTLQSEPMVGRCPHRLPDASFLRPGDAIGIRVSPGLNHLAIFAGALRIDGASEMWLVLESFPACDGVCWSLYDPSVFNGWGLYRAEGRSDVNCPLGRPEADIVRHPIPQDLPGWLRMLRR